MNSKEERKRFDDTKGPSFRNFYGIEREDFVERKRILDFGFWILGFGFWALGFGCEQKESVVGGFYTVKEGRCREEEEGKTGSNGANK